MMSNHVLGLHHVTAIANGAQRNLDFYSKVLGLRLVKKTVNFDDPGTYHFYFGNESGTPGTLLTFFPWEGIGRGTKGVGMATEIAYSVKEGSLDFWKNRFKKLNIPFGEATERFNETYFPFSDPDGLALSLVIPIQDDERIPWETQEVSEKVGLKGFHNVTLTLNQLEPTAQVLTTLLGYQQTQQEGHRYRFTTQAISTASVIDIILNEKGNRGYNAAGTVHHIAFRVKDEEVQMELREKLLSAGLHPTPKIDRDYFYSIYFREPGGVLFEIATENPGFTRDERLEELGSHLMLPSQYEPKRNKIEDLLPKIKTHE